MLYPTICEIEPGKRGLAWKRMGKRGLVARYPSDPWSVRRFVGYPLGQLRSWALEDHASHGLGGPPNNWGRSGDILVSDNVKVDGDGVVKYRCRHNVGASFNNDAHEVWIWERFEEQGSVDESWKFSCPARAFRRMALWYLWRWAWGEWFGLRRKLFYWDLHRRCEKMRKERQGE